jgi:hypothetical protein
MSDFGPIPEWAGVPDELFGKPPSEEGEDWETKLTGSTIADLSWVLECASLYDPDWLDHVAATLGS